MFSARSHVRNLIPASSPSVIFAPWGRRHLLWTSSRRLGPKKLEKSQLQCAHPLAEQLVATGIWKLPRLQAKTDPDTENQIGDELANGADDQEGGAGAGAGTDTGTGKGKGRGKGKGKGKGKGEGENEAAAAAAPNPPKTRSRTKKSTAKKVTGDKARVNIVSEALCDNILKYMGRTLKRHKHCDLIDIYPGAGLWSRKLHEFLKPRSHILMEPDEDLYRPFLEPILEKPGVVLVPKSGILWRDLNSILTPEYLPHQKPIEDPFASSSRNDTLLVTANIAFHPKRRYLGFDSIALLVVHQLLDSIRTSTLFQKYGQVRMLIWARHDDKSGLLPKNLQRRRRGAIEGELYCEWVHEVCGRDGLESIWFMRDTDCDIWSTRAAMRRMTKGRFVVPEGRETDNLRETKRAVKEKECVTPGSRAPVYKRPFSESLSVLEAANEEQGFLKDSAEFKSMQRYRWRASHEDNKFQKMHKLMSDYDAIKALYRSGQATEEELNKLAAEWHDNMHGNSQGFLKVLSTWMDSLHYIRQDPPLMHWDRRAYEPLTVQPDEFFPNIECTLLDIQPKDVHPLLRQTGAQSNHAADALQLIMGTLLAQSKVPVSRLLDAVSPGAAEFIMPRWKSIRDLENGGIPPINSVYAEMTPRKLSARQWEELIELWMQWPFRPEFHELVGRTQDTDDSTSFGDDGAAGPGTD